MPNISKLIENLNKIKTHPELLKQLSDEKYILENEISCHDRPCDQEFKELLNETMVLIYICLITPNGQRNFGSESILRCHDYMVQVTESDSFGPLGCKVYPLDRTFYLFYG